MKVASEVDVEGVTRWFICTDDGVRIEGEGPFFSEAEARERVEELLKKNLPPQSKVKFK